MATTEFLAGRQLVAGETLGEKRDEGRGKGVEGGKKNAQSHANLYW